MTYPRGRLIQFARYPESGKVKTRLAAALTADDLLRLHIQLVRRTHALLFSSGLAPVAFWYGSEALMPATDPFLQALKSPLIYRQCDGDLGQKMYSAFEQTLKPAGGADYAVLVGSDCPFLDVTILNEALDRLASGIDVVLGPAEDGGYYLIGLHSVVTDLFQDVAWGSESVLAATLERIAKLDWSVHLLPVLSDIDIAADLAKLHQISEFAWVKNAVNRNAMKCNNI